MGSQLKHGFPFFSIPCPLTPKSHFRDRWRAVTGNSSCSRGGSSSPLHLPWASALSYVACSLAPIAAESSLLAGLPHCPWSALSFIEILDTLRVESVPLTASAPLNPHPLGKRLTSPTRSSFTHKTRTLISYFSYSGLYCAQRIFIYIAREGREDLIPISQMRNITSKRSCSLVWSHQFI